MVDDDDDDDFTEEVPDAPSKIVGNRIELAAEDRSGTEVSLMTSRVSCMVMFPINASSRSEANLEQSISGVLG